MTRVALLRAINAGVPLAMADLRRLAAEAGLAKPRTFIASGNLLFDSDRPDAEVKALLERSLSTHVGKPVGLTLRTAGELVAVAAANPFPDQPASKVVAIFLDTAPPASALTDHKGRADEQIALGTRELYIFYPQGQGRSRLTIPAAATGTARNMNTVAKLAVLASA